MKNKLYGIVLAVLVVLCALIFAPSMVAASGWSTSSADMGFSMCAVVAAVMSLALIVVWIAKR